MIAVLAEDTSDADTLVELVKRIAGKPNIKVLSKGFGGCAHLRRKAHAQIGLFHRLGATRFIICHDSDGNDPEAVRSLVRTSIETKLRLRDYDHKIVVPVQELEAWIIADEAAIRAVIPTFVLAPVSWPENIASPKEWLMEASRLGRSKGLYVPAARNAAVARHLDIAKVAKKCPSFGELVAFVQATS